MSGSPNCWHEIFAVSLGVGVRSPNGAPDGLVGEVGPIRHRVRGEGEPTGHWGAGGERRGYFHPQVGVYDGGDAGGQGGGGGEGGGGR